MKELRESILILSKMLARVGNTKVNGNSSLFIFIIARDKKKNQRDGLGVQLWPDGSKYEGMWKDGKCSGKGRMTHANGDVY